MAQVEELVVACRILADQGVVDAFGHISTRRADRPDRYLMSRDMAQARVGLGDILEFDLAGELVTPGEHQVCPERFIHGAIYAACPDVMAVVHSHAPGAIQLGVVPSASLRAVFHMGGFLGEETPVFDARGVVGDGSDLRVGGRASGEALARALGSRAVVLMRGSGSAVVGASIRQAVFRAVYAEINAGMQVQAHALGPVAYLILAEADAAAESGDSQIARAWDLWVERASADAPLNPAARGGSAGGIQAALGPGGKTA